MYLVIFFLGRDHNKKERPLAFFSGGPMGLRALREPRS
jgi:hypothetical protein